jgi:cytoskeleton protein RodZ
VGSFGDRLRREREMRGITLDEIATATKISTRNLRALEEEKFRQLPGGVFNRGFVRAYAKFLGIDEDHMVAEYVAASQDTEAAREQKFEQDLSKIEFRHDNEEQREISLEPKSQWGTIAVIVLIAAGGFGGYQLYQKRKAEHRSHVTETQQVQPSAVQTAPPSAIVPAPQPSATINTAPLSGAADPTSKPGTPDPPATPVTGPPLTEAAKPASEKSLLPTPSKSETKPLADSGSAHAGTPIDVKIHADQQCWISIVADGKTIMEGNLDASAERAVRAKEKVVLVLGNAAGVEVSYNGKPLENLSAGQKVRKITFTPDGYE